MDAAQTFKKTALFLVTALMAVTASAQTLVVSSTNVTISSSNQGVPITVTTSTGAAVSFTVQKTTGDTGFYSLATSSNTASAASPAQVFVNLQVARAFDTTGAFTITNSANSADVTTVTVNYSFTNSGGGGGGGTGVITATQSSVSLTPASGSSMSTTVQIQTTSASAIGVSASTSQLSCGNVTWLSQSLNQFSVTSGSPATLTINGNAFGLTSGTQCIGSVSVTPSSTGVAITINVTMTVGGSTTGTSSYSVSPTSVALAYPSGTTQAGISVFSNGPSSFNAFSNVNWISLNGSTGSLTAYPVGSTFTISVNSNAASLATGTTSGTVTVYNPSNGNDFVSIPVSLVVNGGSGGGGGGTTGVLTANPSSLTFNVAAGTTAQQQQQIAISSGQVSQYSASADQSWISVNQSTTFLPGTLYVTVYPGGLAQGTYQGNVVVSFPGTSTANALIPVTLVIGTGGGGGGGGGGGTGTGALVAPTTLTFAWQSGTNIPPGQQISVSPTGNYTITPTATPTNWLSAGNGTGPGSTYVFVQPGGLQPGTYNGQLSVATASGTTTVGVTLIVTAAGSPVLIANPGSINASYQAGGAAQSTGVQITASDNLTPVLSANSSASWISVSANGANSFTITLNPAGLANGLNSGSVTFSALGYTSAVMPVVVNVSGSTGGGGGGNNPGTIFVNGSTSPATLNFTTQQGTAPSSQSVSVTSQSGSAGVSYTVASNVSWLQVAVVPSGSAGTTPGTVTVNVNPGSMAPGTYSGAVTVTSTNSVSVPVTLVITAGNAISVTTTPLSFNYRAGDANPASQSISVTGNGTFTAQATSTGNWLVVSPTSGSAPATLSVSVNAGSLSAGTYSGTIAVTGTGGTTGSGTVTVNLTVTAPLPTITQVLNGASFANGALAAGEVITIKGTNIGPSTLVSFSSLDATTNRFPTTLGGVQVLVGGYPAPMLYASSNQVSAIVPYEIGAPFLVSPNVVVKYLGQSSNGIAVQQAGSAPGIFTANSSGSGGGAILNGNNQLNSPGNPARVNDTVAVYMTGEGATSPASLTGAITVLTFVNGQPFTPKPLLPVTATVDGIPATVSFWGEAPGIVAGLMQVNVVIPQGTRLTDVPIIISVGSQQSQAGVTVSVR